MKRVKFRKSLVMNIIAVFLVFNILVLYSSSVYRPSPRSVCYTVWRYCGLVSVSYHLMVTERLQPQSLCIVVNQLDTA